MNSWRTQTSLQHPAKTEHSGESRSLIGSLDQIVGISILVAICLSLESSIAVIIDIFVCSPSWGRNGRLRTSG